MKLLYLFGGLMLIVAVSYHFLTHDEQAAVWAAFNAASYFSILTVILGLIICFGMLIPLKILKRVRMILKSRMMLRRMKKNEIILLGILVVQVLFIASQVFFGYYRGALILISSFFLCLYIIKTNREPCDGKSSNGSKESTDKQFR